MIVIRVIIMMMMVVVMMMVVMMTAILSVYAVHHQYRQRVHIQDKLQLAELSSH